MKPHIWPKLGSSARPGGAASAAGRGTDTFAIRCSTPRWTRAPQRAALCHGWTASAAARNVTELAVV
ncbi:MAG: hypothetical protein ACHQIL_14410 [Steroidobacterales bacterium]